MLQGSCHCGKVRWTLATAPTRATACSCTACRRYGALWAYGILGEDVQITGETRGYLRCDIETHLAFHFCPECGGMVCWLPKAGSESQRCAVNLRMADPDAVAAVPVHRFDGFDTWSSLPDEGRVVGDVWF
ncbi:MAG: GFA family protein [Alphaproteobacteria bacterium]|nr:GFA family protein [Alphaproteobacteria bacterium]